MAATGCILLVTIAIITVSITEGKVMTNINAWHQDCCQNCPNIMTLVGQEATNLTRYAMICQMGTAGSTPYYATFFDKVLKIPVFSRFSFHLGRCARVSSFLLEGDLTGVPMGGFIYTYAYIRNQLRRRGYNNADEQIQSTQAYDSDYILQRVYQRGHLNPHRSFCNSDDAVQSTFTYTNVAPQVSNFNGGSWRQVEDSMRKYVEYCSTGHTVVVGVTSSNDLPLNGRVNIPSFFWVYVQCSGLIAAILAPNIENNLIKNNYLITQLYVEERYINCLLEAFNNLFYKSRNVNTISYLVTDFRNQMQRYAQPAPRGDVFPTMLDCWSCAGNVRCCFGNRSKSNRNTLIIDF